jgi:predicted CxxxxCH...CXXCH cytochrome family protein
LGTCHSSPPAGGAGGAAGSHAKHDSIFPGLNNCKLCHADHIAEPAPFGHASSAATRGIQVKSSSPFFGPYGLYSGNTRDFLPSQTNSFGKCNNVYCHSSVQGVVNPTLPPATLYAPTWGETFTDGICGGTKGCHGVAFGHPADALYPELQARWKPLESGSHAKHIKYRFNQSGNCQVCHFNFTNTGDTGCTSCHSIHGPFPNHIDRNITIRFNPDNTLFSEGTGSYSGDSIPGTPYGSCSNFYCHSDGTAISSGILVSSPPLQWGSGALSCSSCHGYPPDYTNGIPKANSHQAHNMYGCNKCHYLTTTDGTSITTDRYHVNRAYNVNAGAGVSFTYNFSATGGTCSNVSCHSGSSATWGQQ